MIYSMIKNVDPSQDEIINRIDNNFTNNEWMVALVLWLDNAELLNIIKWLADEMKSSVCTDNNGLLQDIMLWQDKNDELRWYIYKKSESLGFTTQVGALGLALFMLSGSMSPPECEPVYASLLSVKQIILGILITQSVINSNPPSEGARMLFQKWCYHYQ